MIETSDEGLREIKEIQEDIQKVFELGSKLIQAIKEGNREKYYPLYNEWSSIFYD